MWSLIINLIIALPKLLDLVEKIGEIYENKVLERKEDILKKAKNDADDNVTRFITRVEASNRVRVSQPSVATTGGVGSVNDASTNNECNCVRPNVCARCIENHK